MTDSARGLSASLVSDAMDRLGVAGAVLGLGPLGAGQYMAGRAYTVRYVPAGPVPGTVGDYIDDVPAGGVVVLSNGGVPAYHEKCAEVVARDYEGFEFR